MDLIAALNPQLRGGIIAVGEVAEVGGAILVGPRMFVHLATEHVPFLQVTDAAIERRRDVVQILARLRVDRRAGAGVHLCDFLGKLKFHADEIETPRADFHRFQRGLLTQVGLHRARLCDQHERRFRLNAQRLQSRMNSRGDNLTFCRPGIEPVQLVAAIALVGLHQRGVRG